MEHIAPFGGTAAVTLKTVTERWHEAKTFAEHAMAIDHDAMHFLVGVLLWLAIAVLFRRPVISWFPWLSLLVLELINEWGDLLVERWPNPAMQFGEGAKDVVLTMIVPTVLMLAARRYPRLFR